MYIGTQFGCRNDTDIEVLSQLGVLNVDQTPAEPWMEWTTNLLKEMRDRFDKYGINLEMAHIPLGCASAFESEAGAIFLGPSDERDRQIDRMCEIVRMASEAGLRGLNYNITILGHLRTESRKGRGGATQSRVHRSQPGCRNGLRQRRPGAPPHQCHAGSRQRFSGRVRQALSLSAALH